MRLAFFPGRALTTAELSSWVVPLSYFNAAFGANKRPNKPLICCKQAGQNDLKIVSSICAFNSCPVERAGWVLGGFGGDISGYIRSQCEGVCTLCRLLSRTARAQVDILA